MSERKYKTECEFLSACEDVADEHNIEILDHYHEEGERKFNIFEDDGVLHVVYNNTRVAFDVSENQRLSKSAQNANTRKVLKGLGLKTTGEALV